ncbi:MAG: cobyrinate a,c-diamide synthase [Firmicutes bacterium]|nr:cobyrinate a,c-diamide synthase [Bacillota bacterium]
MSRIMIAGTASGVGKTTISLGIMAALTKRNKRVSPYKVGPDYIDPGFHKFVTGNPSHNLDSWLLKENTIKYLFKKNMRNKDIGIIEGVMGLYDGFGTERDQGSSAHVSKILDTPVILVIDGKAMSSSAAAMVLGYKMYDPHVDIKGVIINNVSGKVHYDLLRCAIERDIKVPCLGYLPSNLNVAINSRHLGLIPAEEIENLRTKIDELANMIEEHIDLDKVQEIAASVEEIEEVENPIKGYDGIGQGLRVGVAMDKAFSFYYDDSLNLMKELGIELVPFSPIKDNDLPQNVDGIYLGGGFPEVFAKELEENKNFRNNLKKHLENGLPTYGECGGLMYLTNSIEDLEGNNYKMVGFIPTDSKMTKRLQRFGYVNISINNEIDTKGHEFHRSMIEDNENLEYVYQVYKIRNGEVKKQWKCGVHRRNTLAGYAHIHFYSNIDFLIKLINIMKDYKDSKK